MRQNYVIGLAVTLFALTGWAQAEVGDQLLKIVPADGLEQATFGFDVAIESNSAVIGAPGDGAIFDYGGAAYIWDLSMNQQVMKLIPDDLFTNDLFGYAVDISASTVLVGGPLNDDSGTESGSAYVFNAVTGEQIHKLLPGDVDAEDRFGFDVAIDGNMAIIGAYLHDALGPESGAAYIYDVTTGQQVHKLLPDDGQFSDHFGVAVGISGDIAIVGSPKDDDFGNSSGSAYLFDVVSGEQIAKILPNDGEQSDQFGRSVAIDGTTAVIGAPGDGVTGSAYVFDLSTVKQLHKVLPDTGFQQSFGWAADIVGSSALIGAHFDDDNGSNSGSVYLFDINSGALIIELHADDAAENDQLGVSVAMSDGQIIAGAQFDDDNGSNSGSAYVFDAGMVTTCVGDTTNDGTVNVFDLLDLLAAWGPCVGCPQDLNSDGFVDVFDLLELLAAWGPC